jgi:hypothetical protein
MKATPASTLRDTDPMVRIKSPHMGERKTIHVLYVVFQVRPSESFSVTSYDSQLLATNSRNIRYHTPLYGGV